MRNIRAAVLTLTPLVAVISLLVSSHAPAAQRPLYRVQDLGTLGGSFSVPQGINDAGVVVGSSSDFSGRSYPFYYDTQMHQMAIPAGNTMASAWDISNSGEIVGSSDMVQGFYTSSIPFLYSPQNGGNTTNMGFASSSSTRPYGVNEYGSVVGYFTQPDGQWRAFLWKPTQAWALTGNMTNLGILPGGRDSTAQDVNDWGVVVGTSYAADGLIHAVKWTPDVQNGTTFTREDLGILPGCYGSAAAAVNADGVAVGWAYTGWAGSPKRAMKFTTTGPQDLGSLEYVASSATDINGAGDIVGYVSNANGSVSRGFIYKNGTMYNLNDCLDCFSTDWTVVVAAGINSSGVIACRATDSLGQTRAVKLVPVPDYPVPSIASITPDIAEDGSIAIEVTINGAGFLPCSSVKWDGIPLVTDYLSETTLAVVVSDILLANRGTHQITVTNPEPGGGVSNAVQFTVSGENQPPVINSVTVDSDVAAAGDQIWVQCHVTDDTGISSVTADGITLAPIGPGFWGGSITAKAEIGSHPVLATATDTESATSTNSETSYRTLPVVGLSGKALQGSIMDLVDENYLFVVCGHVGDINGSQFSLNDGSGYPIAVDAVGHSVGADDFVRVRGRLLNAGTSNQLISVSNPERDIRDMLK